MKQHKCCYPYGASAETDHWDLAVTTVDEHQTAIFQDDRENSRYWEEQVKRLVLQGRCCVQIADILGLALPQVRQLTGRILEDLCSNVRTRQAVRHLYDPENFSQYALRS